MAIIARVTSLRTVPTDAGRRCFLLDPRSAPLMSPIALASPVLQVINEAISITRVTG
jgi:hypothetical protein